MLQYRKRKSSCDRLLLPRQGVHLEISHLMYLHEQFCVVLIKDISPKRKKKLLYWELKFRSVQNV